jgi:hypothetical protein
MTEQGKPILPLGVCVFAVPRFAHYMVAYGSYVHEILQHAGVAYATVVPEDLPRQLPALRVLVTVGETTLAPELQQQLRAWVEQGGAWLSVGGLAGMAELFAVRTAPKAHAQFSYAPSLGAGYLTPGPHHTLTEHIEQPLHFFNGIAVEPAGCQVLASVLDAHQRPTPRVALAENTVGRGRCLLIAPDLTGTVVRVQQGISVTRDGVCAPDGTGPIADTVLKTDDGMVLDWDFDREAIPGGEGLSVFLQPIADLWREVLLRAIFHLASAQQVALPVLWLYPRNLPALAELSHDTDNNVVEGAEILLRDLAAEDVHSTWSVIMPGYPPEVIGAIRGAGHELGMHYDSINCPWSEEEFDSQFHGLAALFGGHRPISNKNHYLRWEGDCDFWCWCIRHGIQIDQTKGPSKAGAGGFTFGTCQPYFPVDPEGKVLNVLELPTLSQDLILTAPLAFLPPVLRAAERTHGIMHLLFHPQHMMKAGQSEALRYAIRCAKERGLEFWTATQINTWERARRKARWQATEQGASSLHPDAYLPEATFLCLVPDGRRLEINGTASGTQTVECWGQRFQAVVMDVTPGRDVVVRVS